MSFLFRPKWKLPYAATDDNFVRSGPQSAGMNPKTEFSVCCMLDTLKTSMAYILLSHFAHPVPPKLRYDAHNFCVLSSDNARPANECGRHVKQPHNVTSCTVIDFLTFAIIITIIHYYPRIQTRSSAQTLKIVPRLAAPTDECDKTKNENIHIAINWT